MANQADPLLAAAQGAFQRGSLLEAESLARKAVLGSAENLQAKLILSVVLARQGKRPEALSLLDEILAREPDSYEALISIAALHREIGDIDRASEFGMRAIRVRPNEAQAHMEFGLTWLAGNMPDRAAVAFKRATEMKPEWAPAYHHLGKALQLLGENEASARAFEAATQLSPRMENFLGIAKNLNRLGDYDGALAAARRAVELAPGSAAANLAVASALIGLKQVTDGDVYLKRAVELDIDGLESFQIGYVQSVAGKVEDSNASFRRAMAVAPERPAPYALLAYNTKITEVDRPMVSQMHELVASERVSLSDKGGLHYGLGKALEDLGEYEKSMRHYDEANLITQQTRLKGAVFDRKPVAEKFAMAGRTAGNTPIPGALLSELPVLIFGMMRSGTTLAEQILSSHPAVEAGGELPFWTAHWLEAISAGGDALVPETALALGKEYLEILAKIGPHAKRVTDKMPGNGVAAGLIHGGLPNARMIHIRRNPLDNALSIWTTPNQAASEGGHDKANIVFVFKEYMQLMSLYRSVFPLERFLEVDYEELVFDTERVTRELVAFCGLDWDDACLRPQDNRRAVSTPSVWQVRQPVYKTSVDRWKKFEPWLGELRELEGLKHGTKRTG